VETLLISLSGACHNYVLGEEYKMGTYDWQQLIRRWQSGELSVEQAVGQLILHLQELSERVGRLETEFEVQRQKGNRK
jgi:serine phosphatase RsbU (regulator of sigma subunit)